MSNKNTNNPNNRISYGQYKLLDIFLFLSIMCLCEILNVFAATSWFTDSATFAISVMLLISLTVIIRWGWLGAIFPVVDGLIYCWLLGATGEQFAIYAIGNAFVALDWFFLKFVGKERVVDSWILTLVYAVIGYVLLVLGRSLVAMCFGENFLGALSSYITVESLNLFFAAAGLLILRRFDSMLKDQKQYLIEVTTERDTIKAAEGDYHWDGYTELDTEDLERLKAMDEYDRKVTFNRSSLKALKEQTDGQFGGEYPENIDENPDEDDLSRLDGE